MKFTYYKEFLGTSLYPEYHFSFTLTEDEVRKVTHQYAFAPNWMNDVFDGFQYLPLDHPQKIQASLRILQEALDDKNVDLGTNYKEKYEELVELLKPHKIDEDMSPATTLKMILKYHK